MMIASRGRVRVQESRDRTRRVVGQEAHVAPPRRTELAGARPAGGSRGGQHQRDLRIALRSARTSGAAADISPKRHRMQPDGRRGARGRAPSEALAQSLPIAAIAQPAPQNHGEGERHGAIDQRTSTGGASSAARRAARSPPAATPRLPPRIDPAAVRAIFWQRAAQALQVPRGPRARRAQPAAIEVDHADASLRVEQNVVRIQIRVIDAVRDAAARPPRRRRARWLPASAHA